ncbi:hypothetical protein S245_041623, partial [Arachis hypogaea]
GGSCYESLPMEVAFLPSFNFRIYYPLSALEDGTTSHKGLQLQSSQELMPILSNEFTILFPSEKFGNASPMIVG